MSYLLVMRYLVLLLALTSCATPQTILKNEETGEIGVCGGSSVGSVAGGMIGYNIQRSNDDKCVAEYMAKGFEVSK